MVDIKEYLAQTRTVLLTQEAFDELVKKASAERHGKWIFGATMGHSWMKCSECCVSQSGQTGCFTYCPNCGARMDGEQDG